MSKTRAKRPREDEDTSESTKPSRKGPKQPASSLEETARAGPSNQSSNTLDKADPSNTAQEPGPSKAHTTKANPPKPRPRIRKLVPPRPFPTVPTSQSATGPRSAHVAGKNYICITRKTPLGAYLRRCKAVIMADGHKTLYLSAMGAAIPHMLTLAVSLPAVLAFPPEDIHTEIKTGTVEVHDEVLPDDSDEDISLRKRGKSSVSVVITIGDGDPEGVAVNSKPGGKKNDRGGKGKGMAAAQAQKPSGSGGGAPADAIVFQEEDQDDEDIGEQMEED